MSRKNSYPHFNPLQIRTRKRRKRKDGKTGTKEHNPEVKTFHANDKKSKKYDVKKCPNKKMTSNEEDDESELCIFCSSLYE